LISIFIIITDRINAITINAIAYTYTEETHIYTPLVNEFNKYSIENNLNITINLIIFTPMNSSSGVDDFGSMIETLFKKSSDKYDLYFYDNIYSRRFEPYLIDLKDKLPEDYINEYNPNIISQACTYNNKIVGLVNTSKIHIYIDNYKICF